MFSWLFRKDIVCEAGLYTYNDELLTDKGNSFLEEYYDKYIRKIEYGIEDEVYLNDLFSEFLDKN